MSDSEDDKFNLEAHTRHWTPRLVEVTRPPAPDINDDHPTRQFIDPSRVTRIERGLWNQKRIDGSSAMIECTIIGLQYDASWVFALEAPEEVARRIEKAMHG